VLGERLAGLFSAYSCGASIFGKGAKLRKLVARFPVERSQVLCVGDEIRDVEAARKEGVAFGAVAWGYTRLEALAAHAPEETFMAPADLLALAPSGLVPS
jgi:phosphoglycolate phosphatase